MTDGARSKIGLQCCISANTSKHSHYYETRSPLQIAGDFGATRVRRGEAFPLVGPRSARHYNGRDATRQVSAHPLPLPRLVFPGESDKARTRAVDSPPLRGPRRAVAPSRSRRRTAGCDGLEIKRARVSAPGRRTSADPESPALALPYPRIPFHRLTSQHDGQGHLKYVSRLRVSRHPRYPFGPRNRPRPDRSVDAFWRTHRFFSPSDLRRLRLP